MEAVEVASESKEESKSEESVVKKKKKKVVKKKKKKEVEKEIKTPEIASYLKNFVSTLYKKKIGNPEQLLFMWLGFGLYHQTGSKSL